MRFNIQLDNGEFLDIYMDLFLIKKGKEENYKFSWIAFNSQNPEQRVLFDSHYGKGTHYHFDNDSIGISFEWTGLDDAIYLFIEKIGERFGKQAKSKLRKALQGAIL
jgi:hypothetical protein